MQRIYASLQIIAGLMTLSLLSTNAHAKTLQEVYALSIREGRCADNPISPKSCSKTQERALREGCISRADYEFAVANNLYPSCDDSVLIAVCTCGCFARGARIAVMDGRSGLPAWTPIEEIGNNLANYGVMSLSDDSTLKTLLFRKLALQRFTHGSETDQIAFVMTASGFQIGLTKRHAVLLANGEMVPAESLQVGQELVSVKGQPEKITHIIWEHTPFEVYNVLSSGKTHHAHLIAAEGLIVGDLAWQNSLDNELFRIHVRQ